MQHHASLFGETDLHLFGEGTHRHLYDKLGAHPRTLKGSAGVAFAVWAPNAERLSVIGDFNNWDESAHPLLPRPDGSGIWEGFVPGAAVGQCYKYHLISRHNGYRVDKGDPFARYWEEPPGTASRIWRDDYAWGDGDWMASRAARNALDAPISIYELHLGSWRRAASAPERLLGYRELAPLLAEYVRELGFTHVELMPVMEHPFYGSWGYQGVGYFAPSARYGTPEDLKFFIDHLHGQGIGVLLDWVPSHFPGDAHGLAYFDGTHLYEHADPRQGFHPEWNSYLFNYGRNEVRAFLLSSAHFWLNEFHVDGLRVDAVSSMLYLDYGRRQGEWIPNRYGGRENLEAVDFLRQLNSSVYEHFPDTQVIAEESTAWPMVSRPAYLGGLGFGMKWNMGWMHDTLSYFSRDPVHRAHHHDQLTFSIWYAFQEHFVLPLSHDEVVYGKGSLLSRQPGDTALKFAGLRALLGHMWLHPGKKLLFMGGEFGQWREWNHDRGLDWHLLDQPGHRGVQAWVADLNALLRATPALYRHDFSARGFSWVEASDRAQSVFAYLRWGDGEDLPVLVVLNLTPVQRDNYRLGVPRRGYWRECLNSQAECYGGSGAGNFGGVESLPIPAHGHYHSLLLCLPPFGALVLQPGKPS